MNAQSKTAARPDPETSGFGVLDDKGRLGLPKDVRQSLAIQAGDALSYTLLDGMLWLRVAATPASPAREGGGYPPSGHVVLDDKGRLVLVKDVRRALGIRAGSALAYVLLDTALLLIPQDEQLAALTERAAAALAGAGVTTQDLLDDLPAARAEVMREAYGDAFMDALARQRAALGQDPDDRGHRDGAEGAPRGA